MRIMTLYTKIKHYYIYYSHTILLGLIILFAYLIYGIISSTAGISIGLQITYPYSGHISPTSGQLLISSGGILWTKNPNITINISAEQASSYNLYRNENILILTGESISNNYNHEHSIILSNEGQVYNYQSHFISSTSGIVYSNILNLQLDITPPSSPNITDPTNNIIIDNTELSLSRTPSNDQGIGLEKYRVYFSLVPIFSGTTSIETNTPNITLDSNTLPQGTIFWYVEAIDFLGNTSLSSINFFHIKNSSTVSSSASGGGRTLPSQQQTLLENSSSSESSGNMYSGENTMSNIISGRILQDKEITNKQEQYHIRQLPQENFTNLKNKLLAYYDEYKKLCMNNYGICINIPNEYEGYHNTAPEADIFYNIIAYHNPRNIILPTLGYTMIYFTWLGIILLYFLQTTYGNKIITLIYKISYRFIYKNKKKYQNIGQIKK